MRFSDLAADAERALRAPKQRESRRARERFMARVVA